MPPRKRSAATAAADSSGVEENTQESSKKNPTAETQTETKKQKTTGKSKATTGPRVPEGVQEGYHQPYEVSEAKKKGLFTEKNGCFRVVSWYVPTRCYNDTYILLIVITGVQLAFPRQERQWAPGLAEAR